MQGSTLNRVSRALDRVIGAAGIRGLLSMLAVTTLQRRSSVFYNLADELRGKRALEIGGPSRIFAESGFFPVYSLLDDVSNCNFGATTLWEGAIDEGRTFRYHPAKDPGLQLIREATDLHGIQSGGFDVILSSHNIEHTANPLAALKEWRRVLRPGGLLILIIPHKDGTFDRRRPVTPLAHLIEDFEASRAEDDEIHMKEILALHDSALDPDAHDHTTFEARIRDNVTHRSVHHHVFDTHAALDMVQYAGLTVVGAEARLPFHAIIAARKTDSAPPPDTITFWHRRIQRKSAFRSDRRPA